VRGDNTSKEEKRGYEKKGEQGRRKKDREIERQRGKRAAENKKE
jgi:hypothetical protein